MISQQNLTNDLDKTKLFTKNPGVAAQKKQLQITTNLQMISDKSHSIPAKYPSWGSFHIVRKQKR